MVPKPFLAHNRAQKAKTAIRARPVLNKAKKKIVCFQGNNRPCSKWQKLKIYYENFILEDILQIIMFYTNVL